MGTVIWTCGMTGQQDYSDSCKNYDTKYVICEQMKYKVEKPSQGRQCEHGCKRSAYWKTKDCPGRFTLVETSMENGDHDYDYNSNMHAPCNTVHVQCVFLCQYTIREVSHDLLCFAWLCVGPRRSSQISRNRVSKPVTHKQ